MGLEHITKGLTVYYVQSNSYQWLCKCLALNQTVGNVRLSHEPCLEVCSKLIFFSVFNFNLYLIGLCYDPPSSRTPLGF